MDLATNESTVSGMSTNQPQTHTQPRGKFLLPFSVNPPRPPGPSEAEKKIEALSPELKNEIDLKSLMQSSLATNESAVSGLQPQGQPDQQREQRVYYSETQSRAHDCESRTRVGKKYVADVGAGELQDETHNRPSEE